MGIYESDAETGDPLRYVYRLELDRRRTPCEAAILGRQQLRI